ncbi:hypothetical protein THF1C08_730003 [Vibrio jasicida]|uniref:DUF3265 domain-containing protein n=1 Tax=Vibrio jasicida TaxID=766224 RepID=A0AAU9QWQ1_9VIBR|nr:hypothetical protein THF1C08_730003 [Vibrio jasicida]CAH1603589.1 hypothetical protein THF1A12_750003 [Vibrio jasicida]
MLKHNKAFKTDSQRLAISVQVGFNAKCGKVWARVVALFTT